MAANIMYAIFLFLFCSLVAFFSLIPDLRKAGGCERADKKVIVMIFASILFAILFAFLLFHGAAGFLQKS